MARCVGIVLPNSSIDRNEADNPDSRATRRNDFPDFFLNCLIRSPKAIHGSKT